MTQSASEPLYVHATVVVVGEQGVLIRGGSGTGKSTLALTLISEAARHGLFARLVGDDRVRLASSAGRLTARGHPAIAGLIEERGTGLLPVPHEAAVVVRCIVDLPEKRGDPAKARLPEAGERQAAVQGVDLPRLVLAGTLDPQEGARRILTLLAPSGR